MCRPHAWRHLQQDHAAQRQRGSQSDVVGCLVGLVYSGASFLLAHVHTTTFQQYWQPRSNGPGVQCSSSI
jgi:hypothetical protein